MTQSVGCHSERIGALPMNITRFKVTFDARIMPTGKSGWKSMAVSFFESADELLWWQLDQLVWRRAG